MARGRGRCTRKSPMLGLQGAQYPQQQRLGSGMPLLMLRSLLRAKAKDQQKDLGETLPSWVVSNLHSRRLPHAEQGLQCHCGVTLKGGGAQHVPSGLEVGAGLAWLYLSSLGTYSCAQGSGVLYGVSGIPIVIGVLVVVILFLNSLQ